MRLQGMGQNYNWYWDSALADWVDENTGVTYTEIFFKPTQQSGVTGVIDTVVNWASKIFGAVAGPRYPTYYPGYYPGGTGTILGLDSTTFVLLAGAAVLWIATKKK